MKTRVIIFLAISAILTLSFTFGSKTIKSSTKTESQLQGAESTASAPVGGFISEGQL